MSVIQQIEALLKQRAEIDAQIESLRTQAVQELERVQAVLSQLGASTPKPAPSQPQPSNPLDETDFGNGVGGRSNLGNMSRQDFVDELAELRERSAAKRQRA